MFSTDFIFRQQENLVDNQNWIQTPMQQNTSPEDIKDTYLVETVLCWLMVRFWPIPDPQTGIYTT